MADADLSRVQRILKSQQIRSLNPATCTVSPLPLSPSASTSHCIILKEALPIVGQRHVAGVTRTVQEQHLSYSDNLLKFPFGLLLSGRSMPSSSAPLLIYTEYKASARTTLLRTTYEEVMKKVKKEEEEEGQLIHIS